MDVTNVFYHIQDVNAESIDEEDRPENWYKKLRRGRYSRSAFSTAVFLQKETGVDVDVAFTYQDKSQYIRSVLHRIKLEDWWLSLPEVGLLERLIAPFGNLDGAQECHH